MEEKKKPVFTTAEKMLSHHYSTWDSNHIKAIRNYTDNQFEPINRALHASKPVEKSSHFKTFATLSDALKKHKTPEPIMVHTAMKREPKTVDGNIKIKGFASTSLKPSVARGFAHSKALETENFTSHVLHIKVPKGAVGGFVAHISHVPQEKEFILHPNSKIQINKKPKKVAYRGVIQHHWFGKLVHDGVKEL